MGDILAFLTEYLKYSLALLNGEISNVSGLLFVVEVRVGSHECGAIVPGEMLHTVCRHIDRASLIFHRLEPIVGNTYLLHRAGRRLSKLLSKFFLALVYEVQCSPSLLRSK